MTTLSVDVNNVFIGAKLPGNNIRAFESEATSITSSLYAPIKSYEGAHRFDPRAIWTAAQERQLRWKIDFRVCSIACLLFWCLQLDRGNIRQGMPEYLETASTNE
jgi:hypothetical protein